MTTAPPVRLTQYAHGGGCACKIPPGELEAVVAGLTARGPAAPAAELVIGLDDGDDAAVVRIAGGQGLVLTTDFFTPVVDDAYTSAGSPRRTRSPTSTRWAARRSSP